jgi:hypothetical protein
LLNARSAGAAQHPWAQHARDVLASGDRATVWIANGFFGFFVGPRVHVIDPMSLSDLLLARLPAEGWRPGHFARRVPAGYVETIASGENRLAEPGLASLYDHVRLIVSGPLFSRARLATVWKWNTGAYDALVENTSYGPQRVTLSDVAAAIPEGSAPDRSHARQVRESGIDVAINHPVNEGRVEISVDGNDDYLITFRRRDRDLCHELVRARWPHTDGRRGLAVYVVQPPACAAGFDTLRIHGEHGFGAYFLGHVRLIP